MGKRKKKKHKGSRAGTFQGKRRGHGGKTPLEPDGIEIPPEVQELMAKVAEEMPYGPPSVTTGTDDELLDGILHKHVKEAEKDIAAMLKDKEAGERQIRIHRDRVENNVVQSVEELGQLNELVAKFETSPSEYLATVKRIGVPQHELRREKQRRIFDKGLATIPSTYYTTLDNIFGWDSRDLSNFNTTSTSKERHGLDASTVVLSAMQMYRSVGERLCAVGSNDTCAAEEGDALCKLKGEDIVEALPAMAFWFKRRIQNTDTSIIIVNTMKNVDSDGNIPYSYRLTDHGKVTTSLRKPMWAKDRRILGGLAIVHIDSSGGIGSLSLPLIEGMPLLDGFAQCYAGQYEDRIHELYHYKGAPASNIQLGELEMHDHHTDSNDPVSVPTTEIDMLEALCVCKAVINCMGMMAAEPSYVHKNKKVQRIDFDPNAQSKNERRKGTQSTYTIMELRSEVEEDPPWSDSTGMSDYYGRKEHWRQSHYVRKQHGHKWRRENPDGKEMFFPDGRAYHLCLIRPTKVRASKASKRKGNSDADQREDAGEA